MAQMMMLGGLAGGGGANANPLMANYQALAMAQAMAAMGGGTGGSTGGGTGSKSSSSSSSSSATNQMLELQRLQAQEQARQQYLLEMIPGGSLSSQGWGAASGKK